MSVSPHFSWDGFGEDYEMYDPDQVAERMADDDFWLNPRVSPEEIDEIANQIIAQRDFVPVSDYQAVMLYQAGREPRKRLFSRSSV